MELEMIMVRYGELMTKGKNRQNFINSLSSNIKRMLKKFTKLSYEVKRDHTYIHLNGEDYEEVSSILKCVSGLSSFSPVYRIEKDLNIIKQAALDLLLKENKATFKVKAKRADKTFPFVSDTINREIASYVLKNSNYKVDIHKPDVLLNCTIREDYCYLFLNTVLGLGGYPLGIQGKAMMLLSGGIDSPVACYYMLRRGIKIECIHFASPPYTSEAVIDKLKDLLKVLSFYQKEIKLHIIHFTTLQEQIYKYAGESYAITIMRRMMYRIADRLAKRKKCLILGNGESIGQVASQTLVSIKEIENVCTLPVIRPCAVLDKTAIIETARKIKTFDISIRPFEDCCTIFEPKNVTTAPKREKIEKIEASFDFEKLIDECLNTVETIVIKEDDDLEEFF